VAQVFVAFAFLFGGSFRAFAPIEELTAKVGPWISAVPPWVVRLAAGSEMVGALGLLLPSLTRIKPILTPIAAACLALVMVLAAVFHLTRGEYMYIAVNSFLGGLAVFIAWGRLKKAPIAPRA
jgi:putative oxidoreductase